MKITKSQLKQIILEELKEEEYWSDEKDRPWDQDIKEINMFLQSIAIDAIDHYGYKTRADARKGIVAEIMAIFDNFTDEEMSIRGGLRDILDEEFPLGERGHKDPDASVVTGSGLDDEEREEQHGTK